MKPIDNMTLEELKKRKAELERTLSDIKEKIYKLEPPKKVEGSGGCPSVEVVF